MQIETCLLDSIIKFFPYSLRFDFVNTLIVVLVLKTISEDTYNISKTLWKKKYVRDEMK